MSPGRPDLGRKDNLVILRCAQDLVAPIGLGIGILAFAVCHPERSEGSRRPKLRDLFDLLDLVLSS